MIDTADTALLSQHILVGFLVPPITTPPPPRLSLFVHISYSLPKPLSGSYEAELKQLNANITK